MYGKRHGTGQRQCSGGNGIEYIADGVLCIGKRRVQAAVPHLHRHRQNDRACIVKARVVYGEKGIEDLSYSPYTVRHVHSLALMQADTIDYTYKSAGREPLNCLFALRGACDDILIVKQGLLTDTSIANIALSDGTHWYTPAHPLLKGTKRAALLEEGILQEKDIRPEDLPSFSTVRLFNAMIDWGELELPVRNIIP